MDLNDISDDTLSDIQFELRELATHISWTDEEKAAEYRAVANFLNGNSE